MPFKNKWSYINFVFYAVLCMCCVMNHINAHHATLYSKSKGPPVGWMRLERGGILWCLIPKSWLTDSPNGGWIINPYFGFLSLLIVWTQLIYLVLFKYWALKLFNPNYALIIPVLWSRRGKSILEFMYLAKHVVGK